MREKRLGYQWVRYLLFVLLLPSVLNAQDEARTQITMPYAEFFPYSFTGSAGAAEGYTIDIIERLAAQQNYDVTYIKSPNPRLFFELLENGEVQLTPLLALTPERVARGLPTRQLGSYEVSAFVRKGSEITSVDGLSGRRLGVVSGAISRKVADGVPSVTIYEYERTDDLILPLLLGEIDAAISVADIFSERLRKALVDDKIMRLDETLLSIPYGFIVSPDLPQVQGALDTAIDQVLGPAELARLKDFWFGRDQTILEHPWFHEVALGAAIAAVLVIGLLVVANRLHRKSGRLLLENGANRLLIGSLDSVNAAVAIFDQEMRAVHWNEGFHRHFQKRVSGSREDVTLPNLLSAAETYDGAEPPHEGGGPDRGAAQVERELRAGRTVHRTYRFPEGDVLDVRFFPLGRDHYAMIGVDVTQLDAQKDQIVSQSAQLERQNEQLLAFSSIAAHDLRAPLIRQQTILSFIAEDLVDAGIVLPKDVQVNVDLLKDLSDGMSDLIVDLLAYATAEAQADTPEIVDPNARIKGILPLIQARSGFTVTAATDMPEIWVNPTAFDLVMRNLISNAINHHHRQEGTISLRGWAEKDRVIFEVEDDGPGIPEQARERIFDPFSKLGSAGSSGLGLSFVRSSVQAWGGEVTVHEVESGGTIFRLSAPCPPTEVVQLAPDAA